MSLPGPAGPAPAPGAPAGRSRALWRGVARLLVAVAALAAVLWWADVGRVLALLGGAHPGWLLAALVSGVLSNIASAWRWRALVLWLGQRIGLGWAVGIYFRAVMINALLPGAVVGGDLYRAHGLVRLAMPGLAAGLSVLCDRLSGLWVLVALGAGAAAWGAGQDVHVAVPGLLHWLPPAAWLLLTLALLVLPLVLLALGRRALPAPVVATTPAPGAISLPDATPAPLRRRLALLAHRPHALAQYGWQLLGSAAVQLLSVGVLACGGAALGLALPVWAYALAAVPTFLMATLPISLGGWGTREAAAVLAFASLGVAAPQAVALSVLYGLSAALQAVAGGLLMLRSPSASDHQPTTPSRT